MNFGWFAFDRGGTPAKRDGDNRERETTDAAHGSLFR